VYVLFVTLSDAETASRSGFRLFSSSDPEWDFPSVTVPVHPRKNACSSSDSDRSYIIICTEHVAYDRWSVL